MKTVNETCNNANESASANKVRRIVEKGFNDGETGVADELCSSDCDINICIVEQPRGPEGLKGFIKNSRRGFPDLNLQIEFLLANGDVVFSSWVTHGTHKGDFLVPATGAYQSLRLFGFWSFTGGRLADIRGNWEGTAMMRAFGLMSETQVPSPATESPGLHAMLAGFTPQIRAPSAKDSVIAAIFGQFLTEYFCGTADSAFGILAPDPTMFWTCFRNYQQPDVTTLDRRASAYEHIRQCMNHRQVYIERLVIANGAIGCRWALTGEVVGPLFGAGGPRRTTVVRGSTFATVAGDSVISAWYDVVDVLRQYRDSGALPALDYYRHQPVETALPDTFRGYGGLG